MDWIGERAASNAAAVMQELRAAVEECTTVANNAATAHDWGERFECQNVQGGGFRVVRFIAGQAAQAVCFNPAGDDVAVAVAVQHVPPRLETTITVSWDRECSRRVIRYGDTEAGIAECCRHALEGLFFAREG